MSVFYNEKRKRWQYDLVYKGTRHQGYCLEVDGQPARTKTEAKNYEQSFRVKLKEKSVVTQPRPPGGFSLAEPVAFYLKKMADKSDFKNLQTYAREILTFFGGETDMAAIDESAVDRYAQWARRQRKKIYTGTINGERQYKDGNDLRSTKTINEYLQFIVRSYTAFRMAPVNKSLRHTIPKPPEIEFLDVVEFSPQPIPLATTHKILQDGFTPENRHLYLAYVLSVQTGMRANECATIRESHYDEHSGQMRLEALNTKSKRVRFIPINDTARAALMECRQRGDLVWQQLQADTALAEEYREKYGIQRREDMPFILYRRNGTGLPRPVKHITSNGWKNMKKKNDIKYRWHDTRSAFCTNALKESDIETVKRLAGHKSILTTEKYLQASDSQKIAAVTKLAVNYPIDFRPESLTPLPNKQKKAAQKGG